MVSGTVGEDRDLYDFSNRVLVGRGEGRAIADLGYSSEIGFRAEEVVLQLDRPERRYLGGAFWAPGTELIGRRKLLGAGIETQIDTRLDKEEIRANPLVVFLTQRSRIDIVRDGRILSSRSYEAGNQRVDTAGLPDGAYEVVLRITGADGVMREESRFFNKSRSIPSPGRQDFFAFAGVSIDDLDSLAPSGEPFAQAGWTRRLDDWFALDATVTYIDDELAVQAGGTLVTSLAIVHGALLGTSEGTRGGMIQVGSGGYSRLHFNADLRHLEVRGDPTFLSGVAYDLASAADPPQAAGSDAVSRYWQGGATVSYSLASLQLFGSAFYRKNDDMRATYGVGPSVRWEFLQHAQLRLAVDGNAAFTERGTTGYLGVSLSLAGARSNYAARGGGRFSNVAGEPEGFAGALNGAWHMRGPGGSEVDLGAGYEREPERDNLSAAGQLRGRAVSLNADLLHSENGHTQTQYSAGAQTVFAVGPGVVEVQSRTSGDSMLVVRLDGAREVDRFEVLINDSPAGEIAGGDSLTLPLPAYYAYDVRLRAISGQLTAYDGASRRVGLYPGNVQVLEWDVQPIRIIVGRLLHDDGTPVAGASLKAPGGLAETDLAGNFQIEVTDDLALEVLLANGSSYRVALPKRAVETEWAAVGDVRCCSAPRGGVLLPRRWTIEGEVMKAILQKRCGAGGDGRVRPCGRRAGGAGAQPGRGRPRAGEAGARGHRGVQQRRGADVRLGAAVCDRQPGRGRPAARAGDRSRPVGYPGDAAEARARARRAAAYPHRRHSAAACDRQGLPGDDRAGRRRRLGERERAQGVRRLRHAGDLPARSDRRRGRGAAGGRPAGADQQQQHCAGAVRRQAVRRSRGQLPGARVQAALSGRYADPGVAV